VAAVDNQLPSSYVDT